MVWSEKAKSNVVSHVPRLNRFAVIRMSILFLTFCALIAGFFAKECCHPDQYECLSIGYDKPKNETFFETISYDYTGEKLRADRFSDYLTVNQRHHFTLFLMRNRNGMLITSTFSVAYLVLMK